MSLSFPHFRNRKNKASKPPARRPLALEPLEDRCLLDGVPFTIGGDPRVHPEDFRVTNFASGLNFPYTMQQLSDGSLLVGTSRPVGANFFNSVGELLRLVDANQDGVADGPGTVLYTGLPGEVTAVRQAGTLFFVTTSQAGTEGISVLRAGATPADTLTLLGSINFAFPSGWEHTTFENAVRAVAGQPGNYNLFFNIGSQVNDAKTTATVPVSGLLTGTVSGDAIYEVTVQDSGGTPSFTNLTQIATGLRNAAGMTFDPSTGDFYFEDNGIDGGGNPEEELSADEVNSIPAAQIGGSVKDFGFPNDYIDYHTGNQVGSGGIQPLVAFVPGTGAEIAGPAEIAFAPSQFPAGLNHGIFVGFHGLFDSGGTANDENPVAYVDLGTGQYFRFISNSVAGVGHLNGLLATTDSLFVADMSSNGDIFNTTQSGVIYQIKFQPLVSLSQSGVSLTTPTLGAGSTTTVTLTARDASGNQESSGGLTVVFGLAPGSVGGTFGAVTDHGNGTYTASFTAGLSLGSDTITATIGGQPVTSAAPTLTITPASLVLSAPAAATTHTTVSVAVIAEDALGNSISGYRGTVQFSSSDSLAVLPAAYTFQATDAGRHNFTLTFGTTGSQIVSVTDVAAGLTAQQTLAVSPNDLNLHFVDQLYQQLLHRPPDPFGEQAWWVFLLGGGTRDAVVRGFLQSAEYNTDRIDSLYESILGRLPDPTGLQGFLNLLTGPAVPGVDPVVQFESALWGSAEFYQKVGGTNDSFLRSLYTNVLGRDIDSTGAAAWGAALAQGLSRTAVAQQVLTSSEADQDLVQGYYHQFLGRGPDTGGLNSFVAALLAGARQDDVVAGFLASGEFFNRF